VSALEYGNVEDPALALQLADFELANVLVDSAKFSQPDDADFNDGLKRGLVAKGFTLASDVSAREPGSLEGFLPQLRHLRELDANYVTNGHYIHLPRFANVVFRDKDDDLVGSIGPLVVDGDHSAFTFPLDAPLDERTLLALGALTLHERIRILADLVRLVRYFVCYAGVAEGLRSDAVRLFGELVGLLRAAVADARNNEAADPNGDRHSDASPGGDISNTHVDSLPADRLEANAATSSASTVGPDDSPVDREKDPQ
jgi:hypothetical protein